MHPTPPADPRPGPGATGPGTPGSTAPGNPGPAATTPAATAPAVPVPAGRRPGPLYAKVAGHLAAHPDTWFTVGMLTKAIDAVSTGAVFEALKRMAAAGYATHHSGPHRFRITPAGVAAAGTLPPPAPRTTRPSSGGAAAGGGRRGRPAPVARPNGQLYHPRRLAAGWDIHELRRLRQQGIPVLLYGPPGTGKTAMVEAAFTDLLTIAGTGDTVVDDFLGTWIPVPGGGYDFIHGPLVIAMRQGRALLVDDATLIPPRVLAVLYPAMDGRRRIHIPAHANEMVEAVDGFYVAAGHNPGVHGAILTEALASRFTVHIEVTTDWDLARRLGVPAPAVAAAVELNADLSAGRIGWAPQLRELLGFTQVRTTLGLATAVANLAGRAPDDDRADVAAALSRHFGTPVTALTLGTPPSGKGTR